MTKEIVFETMKALPDEFSIDELHERLVFIEKINEGIKDIEEGRIVSHADMKKRY